MKTHETATAKVGGITQNKDLEYVCFQEKYYWVCIARAALPAVNESVCEDSHTQSTCSLQLQQFLCILRF